MHGDAKTDPELQQLNEQMEQLQQMQAMAGMNPMVPNMRMPSMSRAKGKSPVAHHAIVFQ